MPKSPVLKDLCLKHFRDGSTVNEIFFTSNKKLDAERFKDGLSRVEKVACPRSPLADRELSGQDQRLNMSIIY